MIVNGSVDCSSLNAALEAQRKSTSRTMEKCVTSAAVAVCDRAYELTPTIDKAQIVTDLGVMITYRKNKRTGADLAHNSKNVSRRQSTTMGREVQIPLGKLILLAQMNHAGLNRGYGTGAGGLSNYNILTDMRFQRTYARPGPSLDDLETQMLGARFKSGGFIRLGFAAARRGLRRLKDGGGPPMEGEAIAKDEFGRAWMETSPVGVSVTIENLIGMTSGKNQQNYNQAMLAKAGPALEQAVNDVAVEKWGHIIEKELEIEAAKFNAMP
jgi:hypothetical protein